MCGRIALNTPDDELAELFRASVPEGYRPRYNIAPSQHTPIVRAGEGDQREIAIAHWGFTPRWYKPGDKSPRPINARSETAGSSRMFGSSLTKRRCVVPASGFYEWQATPGSKTKQPFHIYPADGGVFCMAGIWTSWQPEEGPAVDTFAILTCAPNTLMRRIHDRMPVILDPESMNLWLDPAVEEVSELEAVLRPFDADEMTADPVSPHVNKPANDDARCIEPVDFKTQSTLFG